MPVVSLVNGPGMWLNNENEFPVKEAKNENYVRK